MVWQRGPVAHGEKAASMLSHNFDSVGRLCLAGVLCSNTYLTPFVASPTPLCSLAIAHVRECAREGGAFARRECFIFLAHHPPAHPHARLRFSLLDGERPLTLERGCRPRGSLVAWRPTCENTTDEHEIRVGAQN